MIRNPIWSSWAKFKTNIDQKVIQTYADEIRSNWDEFCQTSNTSSSSSSCGQIEIDDKWESEYGNLNFDQEKFPDPESLVKNLHDQGFTVSLWTTPFINKNSTYYSKAENKNYFVSGYPNDTVNWWQCPPDDFYCAGIIDFSNPEAYQFRKQQYDDLVQQYQIDGFKFDP